MRYFNTIRYYRRGSAPRAGAGKGIALHVLFPQQ